MRFLRYVFPFFIFSLVFIFPLKTFAFSGAGSGTSGDPYQVTTCAQILEVQSALSAYYLQENNIDCTDVSFTPIGRSFPHFTGSYDGNGYKITNLSISYDDTNVGLFGEIGTGGIVTRVGLASGSIISTYSGHDPNTGSIAGLNSGTISKSYSLINVSSSSDSSFAGGLVGWNSGTISDSYATGTVTAHGDSAEVGGFAGYGAGTITRVYATGSVVSGNFAGGLLGELSGTLSDSFSTATVDLGASRLGGLVGSSGGSGISNSYWNKLSGSPLSCYSTGNTGCTAIDNNAPYFYTVTNAPMSSWDFSTVWSTQNNGTDFPILKWQETPTPTPTTASGNNSSASSNNSNSGSADIPTCTYTPSAPNLFQINNAKTAATLFFSPVGGASNYQVSYGLSPNTTQYIVFTNQGSSTGVLSYTVNSLPQNSTIYFKVSSQNACGQGNWSNTMAARTGSPSIVYNNVISQITSIIPHKTTVLKSVPSKSTSVSIKLPAQKSVSTPKPAAINPAPHKSCFLFICW